MTRWIARGALTFLFASPQPDNVWAWVAGALLACGVVWMSGVGKA